jgi:hypothetical protein
MRLIMCWAFEKLAEPSFSVIKLQYCPDNDCSYHPERRHGLTTHPLPFQAR